MWFQRQSFLLACLQLEAMQQIAKASQNRSIAEFEKVSQEPLCLDGGSNFLTSLHCVVILSPSHPLLSQTIGDHREYVAEDPIVKVGELDLARDRLTCSSSSSVLSHTWMLCMTTSCSRTFCVSLSPSLTLRCGVGTCQGGRERKRERERDGEGEKEVLLFRFENDLI